jgi:hypothetical protein
VVWESRAELNRMGWALDQLDSLVAGPNLDKTSLGRFFDLVRNSCSRFARRLDADNRRYFSLLCEDLGRLNEFGGIKWPVEEAEKFSDETLLEDLIASRLNSRSVGIYTLNESAAVRAASLIRGINGTVTVRLSHDHGGSEKLKGIARDSDYLIVVTQSAKHAATEFIKAQRHQNASDLIYPSGRGAASIVSALKRAVASENS